MADQRLKIDDNGRNIMGGIDNVTGEIVAVEIDHATGRVLTDSNAGDGFEIPLYDYVAYTNVSTTADRYVFKTGGASGTTVATVDIVYTDTTKSQISTVTKT